MPDLNTDETWIAALAIVAVIVAIVLIALRQRERRNKRIKDEQFLRARQRERETWNALVESGARQAGQDRKQA